MEPSNLQLLNMAKLKWNCEKWKFELNPIKLELRFSESMDLESNHSNVTLIREVKTTHRQTESEAEKDVEVSPKPQQEEKVESHDEVDNKCQQVETEIKKDDRVETQALRDDDYKLLDLVCDQSIDELGNLWSFLLKNFLDEPKIPVNKLGELGIKIQPFDPHETAASGDNNCHRFFSPRFLSPQKREILNALEPDLSEPVMIHTIKRFSRRETPWIWPFPKTPLHTATDLASNFSTALDELCWTDDKGTEITSLMDMDMSAWISVGGVSIIDAADVSGREELQHPSVFHKLYDSSETPCIWFAREKPHIAIAISHVYDSDDETIFLAEVVVILALTIRRLRQAEFPNENIVPVMVFSFTDKCYRILQAHVDCEKGLVIRRTMFRKVDLDSDPYMKALLCYGACSPVGPTRDLRTPTKWFHLPQ